jgi:hypothetical protein
VIATKFIFRFGICDVCGTRSRCEYYSNSAGASKVSGRLTFRYVEHFAIELQQLNDRRTKKDFRQITAELKTDDLNFLRPILLPQIFIIGLFWRLEISFSRPALNV